MEDQLIETWAIHNRINLYMLDAIPDDALRLIASHQEPHGLRPVRPHPQRPPYVAQSRGAGLIEGLNKLETKTVGDKRALRKELESSGRAIEALLKQAMAAGGKVKGFKPHAVAFLGYLISHESHHRGQAGWALKASGRPLDQKTAFGLWEWGVR